MTIHPAQYSPEILDELKKLTAEWPGPILDPYAGIGGIHLLGRDDTWGVEIEPEFVAANIGPAGRLLQGDSSTLRLVESERGRRSDRFVAVNRSMDDGAYRVLPRPRALVFSPDYGNRMADQYLGTPEEQAERAATGKLPRRRSYAISLGRPVSRGSTAGFAFGPMYEDLHTKIFRAATNVCVRPAMLALNVSNFIRGGEEMFVVRFWIRLASSLGWTIVDVLPVATRRFRDGANREERVDYESIVVAELRS